MQDTTVETYQHSLRAPGEVSASNLWRDLSADLPTDPEWQPLVESGVFEPLHPDVIKSNHGRIGGGGTYLRVQLGEGIVAGLANLMQNFDSQQSVLADAPVLMIRASLSSGSAYTVPGMPTMVFDRPEVVIAYVPVGLRMRIDVHASARQHGVLLFINARCFLRHFGLAREDVPAALLGMFSGEAEAGRLITLPLDNRMAALVETATRPLQNPALLRLATDGAVRELVALALDAAERNPSFAGASGLRRRDVQLAHAARDLLDRDAASPPLLSTLARDLGSNQKTLKQVFREAFGLTMSDYCVQRRMRMAQALLLDGNLTIGQVAERVGYSHQSSFTAAFRDHAGVSPKDYRRHRAALDVSLPPAPVVNPKADRSA